MTQRLNALREAIKEASLDGLFVSTAENRQYLSGFMGTAGYLLVTQENAILATDFRYVEQAGRQAPSFQVLRIGTGYRWLSELLGKTGVKKLGFESENVSFALHGRLLRELKETTAPRKRAIKFVATSGVVERLRAFKDMEEMQFLQRAIDISDRAMDLVTQTIEAGQTEQEVAWRMEVAMRELGADSPSFDTIVGSGPNGALPHHHPGDRLIQEGEPIVIDMGAKYQGYCSDLTRTVVVGQPDEKFNRVYDTVLGAQLTAMATVRDGMTGADADHLARKVIEEAGYGDNFGHSLGHGVGLEVHEYPNVGPGGQGRLEQNMVFTIEPGIYLSGWGGVRIEDIVVLENEGARALSKAIKHEVPGGSRWS